MFIYYNEIIYKNLFFWLPIIIMFFTLYKVKNTETKKLLTFNFISYISFLIFFFSLFFLGETNVYQNMDGQKYWVSYSALLIGYKIFLYVSVLCLAGQIYYKHNNKLNVFLIFLIFLSTIVYNINNFEKIYLSDYNARVTLYIVDKFSVYYFRNNKTAILPKENIQLILPINNNLMPIDLKSNKYKNKIYYKNNYPYLAYLQCLYDVNVSPGMMFTTNKEAKRLFINNGGILTKKEIQNIKFANIENI